MSTTELAPLPPVGPEVVASGAAAVSYRAHLDGLRTVAVYLVVLFHAGLARLSGGFIGVDVFFVLSGYLVTQMLVRDMHRPGGVRYGRFYARRMRRLLPASAVMLVVTAVVYSAVAVPGQAFASRGSFQASFLYSANWYFIRHSTGYFGAAVGQNPVLHVWSLAVEEQFYLVWPLVLGGLFWLAGRRRGGRPVERVRVLVAVAAVASLGWAVYLQSANPDRGYFGTDARAYQLLAGALLALAPGVIVRLRRRVPSRTVPFVAVSVALLALVGLASSAVAMGAITRGAATTVVTLAIIAGLEWQPGGPVGRFLSCEPMVYLGKISYGTYLWHWPVIIIAAIVADPSPLSLAAITLLVATGLAAISSQLMEVPIRRSPSLDRHPTTVIGASLAVSLVGALVVIPAVLPDNASGTAEISSSAGFTPVPDDLDLDRVYADAFGETVECRDEAATACTIVDGDGPHVLLMGDSNAEMLIPGFEAMARTNGLSLSLAITEGCPWQRGIDPALDADCTPNKEDAYTRVIPELTPDIVFAVNTEYPKELVGPPEALRSVTSTSLDQLAAPGRTIVMMEPLVHAPVDANPIQCLRVEAFVEDCRFVADTTPSQTDTIYAALAQGRSDVKIANLDALACPYLPICDPLIDGRVVRWDAQHLATAYSASLGDELTASFARQGLLPR